MPSVDSPPSGRRDDLAPGRPRRGSRSVRTKRGSRVLTTNTPLVAVELIAACIWVGSLVCLALVTNVARSVLDGHSRVTFFQAIGRRYAIAGTGSLLVAIGAGLALAWPPSSWSSTIDAAVALAGVLVLATAVGMIQARQMTTLRRQAMGAPDDQIVAGAVRGGGPGAGGLRGLRAVGGAGGVV